jgi:hypothetical protein
MRIHFVLVLPVLAGCASAAAEPATHSAPERRPVIMRIVRADTPRITTIDAAKVTVARIQLVDGACRTGDRMPTARRDFGALAPMPSAQTTREVPYIPNVCPVLATQGHKPAAPAALQRGPKRVREPGAQR